MIFTLARNIQLARRFAQSQYYYLGNKAIFTAFDPKNIACLFDFFNFIIDKF